MCWRWTLCWRDLLDTPPTTDIFANQLPLSFWCFRPVSNTINPIINISSSSEFLWSVAGICSYSLAGSKRIHECLQVWRRRDGALVVTTTPRSRHVVIKHIAKLQYCSVRIYSRDIDSAQPSTLLVTDSGHYDSTETPENTVRWKHSEIFIITHSCVGDNNLYGHLNFFAELAWNTYLCPQISVFGVWTPENNWSSPRPPKGTSAPETTCYKH